MKVVLQGKQMRLTPGLKNYAYEHVVEPLSRFYDNEAAELRVELGATRSILSLRWQPKGRCLLAWSRIRRTGVRPVRGPAGHDDKASFAAQEAARANPSFDYCRGADAHPQ